MRTRTIAAATAIAAMGLALAAPSAQAAEKDRHCVVNLSTQTKSTKSMSCYDSFTDAIAEATGGHIADAPDDSRAVATDHSLVQRLNTRGMGTAASAPISIMYKDADFGGDSLIYTGDFDCTPTTLDVDYWVELITPSGWNDQIGSYHTFRNCWVSLFEHRGWAGGSIAYAGDRTDLGILDDKASSIRWS